MTDKTNKNDNEQARRTQLLRDIMPWMQAVGAILILCAVPGQWYIYRDRQDSMVNRIHEQEVIAKTKSDEYERWRGEMAAFVNEQRAINLKLISHVEDRSIHINEDQMKLVISSQVSQITTGITRVEGKAESMQKQLDRIEQSLLSSNNKHKIENDASASR